MSGEQADSGRRAMVALRLRPLLPAALVFALALAARTAVIARSAGFDAWTGYDASVYYAASSSVLHGRLPYADFVLLHPPVAILALLPAALLGHLTTDHVGFLAATVEGCLVGAINAVLVMVVGRRLGLGTRGVLLGGILYAAWFAPVVAEHSSRLEPFGNLFLLLGLLALVSALDRDPPRRRLLLLAAGALLATAASTKIWFVVPLVVATGWVLLVRRRHRDAALMAAGALAAGVLIDVPFLIASHGAMWTMVVTAQMQREPYGAPYVARLVDLTTTYWPEPTAVTPAVVVSASIGVAILAAVLVLAWRVPAARLVVVLAIAAVLTLLVSPVWFQEYADFAAAPIALSAGAAAVALPARLRLAGLLPAAGALGLTVAAVAQGYPATRWWGPAEMTAAARQAHCVTSDTPAGLIALNALDRDLENGCPVWVDPIGRGILYWHAAGTTLATNAEWQQKMVGYLRSGDLAYPYLLRRPFDARSRAELARNGTVLRASGDGRRFVLYRGDPCAAACE